MAPRATHPDSRARDQLLRMREAFPRRKRELFLLWSSHPGVCYFPFSPFWAVILHQVTNFSYTTVYVGVCWNYPNSPLITGRGRDGGERRRNEKAWKDYSLKTGNSENAPLGHHTPGRKEIYWVLVSGGTANDEYANHQHILQFERQLWNRPQKNRFTSSFIQSLGT